MSDLYYAPEKSGLEIVESFDDPQASYSFNMFVIWKRKADGAFFYGTDSGCSCPSPFEDIHKVEDLTQITPNSWETFKTDFEKWAANDAYSHNYRFLESHVVQATLDKIRADMYAQLPAK